MNEEKEVKQVTEGPAKTRKKGMIARIIDTFFVEDFEAVKQHAVEDVFIPGAKDMIRDTINNSVDRLLYGDGGSSRPRTTRSSNGIIRTNYSGISTSNKRTNVVKSSFDNPVVGSRGDAQMVLDTLSEIVQEFGIVSVSDLYQSCGLKHMITPNMNTYGWEDISGFSVKRWSATEYEILCPRPIVI